MYVVYHCVMSSYLQGKPQKSVIFKSTYPKTEWSHRICELNKIDEKLQNFKCKHFPAEYIIGELKMKYLQRNLGVRLN